MCASPFLQYLFPLFSSVLCIRARNAIKQNVDDRGDHGASTADLRYAAKQKMYEEKETADQQPSVEGSDDVIALKTTENDIL